MTEMNRPSDSFTVQVDFNEEAKDAGLYFFIEEIKNK